MERKNKLIVMDKVDTNFYTWAYFFEYSLSLQIWRMSYPS